MGIAEARMDRSPAAERLFRIGKGNWDAFDWSLDTVTRAAEGWAEKLKSIERPWLCWSVSEDWSLLQQRLVASVGWTPIVGFDPRVGPSAVIPEAVLIDFNSDFQLPTLFPHFVLEFAFVFADRLAFWHSDLLLTESDMSRFASIFEALEDGEMAAVSSPSGWRRYLAGRKWRYWELLGCTTRAASQSQFDRGCGWWLHFYHHPNFIGDGPDRYHWECGCGIAHWKRAFGGRVHDISECEIGYGHFTRINQANYLAAESNDIFRDLNKDLERNFSIERCANSLGLSHFLTS